MNTSLSSIDTSVDSGEADDIERMQQILNGRRTRAPFLLVQTELQKCRKRDLVQCLKAFLLLVLVMQVNWDPTLRYIKADLTMLLIIMVVGSGVVCALIPCIKGVGYMLSLATFIQVFLLSVFQEEFTLHKGGDELEVSFAITFTFCIGIFGYIFSLCFFFYQREFERTVYCS